MKSLVAAAAALVSLALAAPALAAPAAPACPDVGAKAPPFALLMSDGREGVSLRKALEKKVPIVLDFWRYDCKPCKEELPFLQKVQKDFEGKVTFLLVHVGPDEQKMADKLKELGISLTSASDDTMKKKEKYCANELPLTLLIDANGVIRSKYNGLKLAEFEQKLLADLASLGVK